MLPESNNIPLYLVTTPVIHCRHKRRGHASCLGFLLQRQRGTVWLLHVGSMLGMKKFSFLKTKLQKPKPPLHEEVSPPTPPPSHPQDTEE